MNLPVIMGPESEQDIKEARAFYKNINSFLADRFLTHIRTKFNLLSANPKAFPIAYKHYRRILLSTFPFAIFYTIEETHIRVLALLHQQRNIEQLLRDR